MDNPFMVAGIALVVALAGCGASPTDVEEIKKGQSQAGATARVAASPRPR